MPGGVGGDRSGILTAPIPILAWPVIRVETAQRAHEQCYAPKRNAVATSRVMFRLRCPQFDGTA